MSDFRSEADPETGEAQWRRLAEKALGGAPLETLNALLDTGAEIAPLQTPLSAGDKALASGHPGAAPFVRGTAAQTRPWQVLQLADPSDPVEANAQAREDLANGADGLWLQLAGGVPYGGSAIDTRDLSELEQALANIPLESTPLYLSPCAQSVPVVALLIALARKQGVAPDKLSGALGLDPLSVMAAHGEVPVRAEKALADTVDAALFARREGVAMRPFLASGRIWHQAGGSAVEELACTLAAAVAYWRALADADMPVHEAARMIGFHLTADPDVFLSIAKFRAVRALWARVTEAAGIAPQPARISAEMSFRTTTSRDPHTNLLRATAAAFAAGTGGAQAILLLPFSAAAGAPDGFARRLARNAQVILAEESALGRVVDAPGGSWYVETLTHDLAARAWAVFQDIEQAGGLLSALKSGDIARRLEGVRKRRAGEIARRERAITGVSTYPHLNETPAPVASEGERAATERGAAAPDLPPAGHGQRMAALVEAAGNGANVASLSAALHEPCEPVPALPDPARRDAAGFEALRAASDEARQVAGVRPSVFLANIGQLAAFTERATWAKNFFEAGGIEAIDSPGFDSAEALADAFSQSGALIACLCGRDEDYAKLAGAVTALRERGAAAVYIVGKPDTLEMLLEADARAIQRVLFEGCDALTILREAHDLLKVDEVIGAARRRAADETEAG
ncbi:methylmalonyl-CoA mutase family protein [Dichotomicrobium thermohalophilum]|uniref:Heterodimeric methylmalonyl-CoA mutase small subunit n=1 Tax=Dichotomicrobium thermohalophilum TaxID=933063 RepID=A0A397QE28_9HYPH|nr:methylmalonyl-CoA mutase family protein [Dichotomicrobium thermohalophilum]RIA56334.1 heterodimeric methylmalonyl-CoA mutase small subunit [Dichotomicrobium thermohalophilum]